MRFPFFTSHESRAGLPIRIGVCILAVLFSAFAAQARPGRIMGRGYSPGFIDVPYRHSHVFFNHGYFYRRINHNYYLAPAPLGVEVPFLPLDAVMLTAAGLTYYYYGGNYYREIPDGYTVVAKPDTVFVQEPAADTEPAAKEFVAPETKTVMIHNTNGSKTPVVLELVDGVWKGPRGEEYDSFPTNEQLRSAYGF